MTRRTLTAVLLLALAVAAYLWPRACDPLQNLQSPNVWFECVWERRR